MTQTRFPSFDAGKLLIQWFAGWGGKYAADYMRSHSEATLDDMIAVGPIGTYPPPINAPDSIIRSWFGTLTQSPYDMKLITKTTIGQFQDYQSWRYRSNGGSTYSMFYKDAYGVIAKEYKIGDNGKVEFLSQYFIAVPVEFVG